MADTSHSDTAANTEPPGDLTASLERLKQAIWSRRPILGEIMQKHGDKILHTYAKDFLDVNPAPGLDERKPELIAATKAMVEARMGKAVAEGVEKQLKKYALVSTTDHHGPIDHPFFVNANIISGIPYGEKNDPDLKYLVVYSFASVSVNNASAYPRGILFHGGVGDGANYLRLPILPDKLKMGVVYGTRAFTRDDLTKAEMELQKKELMHEIKEGRGEKIRQLMEEYFARPDVLSAPDLDAQIAMVNYHLWPRLFHAGDNGAEAKSGPDAPDLIYVEIETLVANMLLERHLQDPQSLMHKVMFNPQYRELGMTLFNNLAGAFSVEKHWGTYFFWGMDEKLHRVRLMPDGDVIRSADGKLSIPWTPDGIAHALREKKILPAMLICYLMVSLYYGMKCLGGFCQVHDLTMVKEAWMKLLREVGETAEADAIIPVQTKELGGDGMVLPYYPTSEGNFVPATGFDMILHPGETLFQKYVERSKRVTLWEMMAPMLPEMYIVLYPVQDRDPSLLAITSEQILQATGIREKLQQGFPD